jgi:uncharacterized protein (UPF0248 family)
MPKQSNIQLRGHCQFCGRLQAVRNGKMSKHGYEVKDGWFAGICAGEHFEPIEVSREQADSIVAQVMAQVVDLRQDAYDYRVNIKHPAQAKSGKGIRVEKKSGFSMYTVLEDEYIPYEQANEYHQEEARKSAAWWAENRASQGESFAQGLKQIADLYHGEPLVEIEKSKTANPILIGEQRKSARGVLTVTRVDGARVYWRDERGFVSWTGSRAWRNFELV